MAKTEVPQDPQPIEVPGVPASAATASPVVQTEATISSQSMLNIMRAKFSKEHRIRVKVKNDGPVQVQVNGYSFLIAPDTWVEVPESVAELLDSAGYI